MSALPMQNYTANQNGARSLEEAVSEVQREIDVRRRLYDRWVEQGKLTRVDAHDRLERMLSALRYLLACPADKAAADVAF